MVAAANVALVLLDWPHPSKLSSVGGLLVCGESVLLAYCRDPARFHRPVTRAQVPQALAAAAGFLAVALLLAVSR
ncbi:MAG TPA: hypothetical protein VID48_15685 [Solirubrobacteraceae bacterium]